MWPKLEYWSHVRVMCSVVLFRHWKQEYARVQTHVWVPTLAGSCDSSMWNNQAAYPVSMAILYHVLCAAISHTACHIHAMQVCMLISGTTSTVAATCTGPKIMTQMIQVSEQLCECRKEFLQVRHFFCAVMYETKKPQVKESQGTSSFSVMSCFDCKINRSTTPLRFRKLSATYTVMAYHSRIA